jgi:NAD(P)-dependent dehydrogenase (short-subunit alcohol dehydrogenase family)
MGYFDLKNKVAIVTGGGRGIGQAYCLGFAKEGAKVVVADIISGDETVEQIKAKGGDTIAVTANVTQMESLTAMAKAAIDQFGRIDILVNNAALYGDIGGMKAIGDISEEEWDRLMAINVKGVWNATKAVLPQMQAQNYGKIINISSATILMGVPGILHYVTSKGAVWAMTRGMARELGPQGIRVNTLMPGFTMSQASKDLLKKSGAEGLAQQIAMQSALGREQKPEDLVGAVLYLASPASDFMTGQSINVDGGVVVW